MAEKAGRGRGRWSAVAHPKDQAPPPSGHNVDPKKKALEVEEAQLLTFVSRARAQQAKIIELEAPLKAAKTEFAEMFGGAKKLGTRKELQALLDDVAVTGSRKDLTEAEQKRLRFREWLGLPVGTQLDLLDKMPDEAKDEIGWESVGYAAGVRADEPKPPSDCPPRMHQHWLKGYHNGQARNAWAGGVIAAAQATAAAVPEPATPLEVAVAEAEAEPDPAAVTADQVANARAALDNLGGGEMTVTGETLGPDIEEDFLPEGDGADAGEFEMSQEELDRQVGRPRVEDDAEAFS